MGEIPAGTIASCTQSFGSAYIPEKLSKYLISEQNAPGDQGRLGSETAFCGIANLYRYYENVTKKGENKKRGQVLIS